MKNINKIIFLQGSGWGWLGWDTVNKSLRLFETGNQDLPELLNISPILSNLKCKSFIYIYKFNNLKIFIFSSY